MCTGEKGGRNRGKAKVSYQDIDSDDCQHYKGPVKVCEDIGLDEGNGVQESKEGEGKQEGEDAGNEGEGAGEDHTQHLGESWSWRVSTTD